MFLLPISTFSTLADFRYKRKYAAKKGENGRGGRCRGKNTEDLIIRVPVGTVVKRRTAEESLPMFRVMNPTFKEAIKKAVGVIHLQPLSVRFPVLPKRNPGEEFDVVLELKLLADVGLVGFPNVRKKYPCFRGFTGKA